MTPGALHELFGAAGDTDPRHWQPPLLPLVPLLLPLLLPQPGRGHQPGLVVWIGARCRPWPAALARGDAAPLLGRCLFVDPPTRDQRLWAIDLALRSSAAAAVIADGSGLPMPATRRLQLAAAHRGCLALLMRPPSERHQLSAARTRWLIEPEARTTDQQHTQSWTLKLLRCKGPQPATHTRTWSVHRHHGTTPSSPAAAFSDWIPAQPSALRPTRHGDLAPPLLDRSVHPKKPDQRGHADPARHDAAPAPRHRRIV